jgi:Protein of unknown function (DUF3352)
MGSVMRGLLGAGLAALVLATAACGGSSAAVGGTPGVEAVQLVPADALAFVSANTDLDSQQWRRLDDLTRGLPARDRLVQMVRAALSKEQLNLDRDVRPALGNEVDLAVLGIDQGEPEVVALAQPEDELKLEHLASLYDAYGDHYTVERIGDWSVVADSHDAFAAVRAAEDGASLADQAGYKAATARLDGDALARVYVDGDAVARLGPKLGALARIAGRPAWAAASVTADDDALGIRVAAARTPATPAAYTPRLLREVPSGAALAVSFRGVGALLSRIDAEPALAPLANELREYLGVGIPDLAGVLGGEGVLYARAAGIFPALALELETQQPAEAAKVLRKVAAQVGKKAGSFLTLSISTRPGRVVLATSPQAAAALAASGPKLVDDQAFKDARANADVPGKVTAFAYADVPELLPLVQVAAAALGTPLPADKLANLQRLRTVVAYGANDGTAVTFSVRVGVGRG